MGPNKALIEAYKPGGNGAALHDAAGKLGGAELNYGSDLDILFVADSRETDLPELPRLAAQFMDLLSSPTELGVAFVTDARLRPDGEKGLLVNTLDAYEEYYRRRAMLWEIRCLTRARPVAGATTVFITFSSAKRRGRPTRAWSRRGVSERILGPAFPNRHRLASSRRSARSG